MAGYPPFFSLTSLAPSPHEKLRLLISLLDPATSSLKIRRIQFKPDKTPPNFRAGHASGATPHKRINHTALGPANHSPHQINWLLGRMIIILSFGTGHHISRPARWKTVIGSGIKRGDLGATPMRMRAITRSMIVLDPGNQAFRLWDMAQIIPPTKHICTVIWRQSTCPVQASRAAIIPDPCSFPLRRLGNVGHAIWRICNN